MQISQQWEPAIRAITAEPGIAVVIGATDAGKTTFCLQLLNAAAASSVPAAIVDADVGQSEVGPPGTVGMAPVQAELDSFAQISARRLYFVGLNSPIGHLLPIVVGAKRLTDEAQAKGAKLVVLDTSGLVHGPIARRLKTYKIDLLQPKHIVGIQKSNEVEHLLAAFGRSEGIRIHRLPVTPEAVRKPQEYRAARRRSKFYDAFYEAAGHILHLDQVVCRNTDFMTGAPLAWRQMKEVEETLGRRVLHAEAIGRGLYVVTDGQPEQRAANLLMERRNTRDITIVPASAFQHILVGLSDASGMCMDVGLLHAIDFKHRYMFVLSKIKTISPVKIVQFGSMRVKPDGTELGKIRPGEI